MDTAISKPTISARWAPVLVLLLIVVLMGNGAQDTHLYDNVTWYAVTPLSGILGALVAWLWMRDFRAKDYKYRDQCGGNSQDEPSTAALKALFIGCVMAAFFWGIIQSLLLLAVRIMPATPVTFATTVTGLENRRGCHSIVVVYRDTFTSGEARQCVANAPGQRRIGEPVTVDEFAGLLGTRFDRITYKDVPYGGR
ncbi:hypothetical protein GCM10007862_28690 [Dyella lipolytica]|uniref:Uncharacterized protein n=1 Tax=Dyella lipolytica TaxID=1867835 RepID=A0ABW8IYC8_9GAMM|nr:hypothetical protein [Dyella lipolytica]GLQ47818.1 hypothetical protein GCM10007862_28690 [Dyella lipolytica]